jgi:Flp pilus assembly protein TadD
MRAALAYIQGDTALEIEHYRTALAADSEDHLAHKSLAAALFRNGETDLAIRHFREATRIRPDEPTYHYDLAQVLSSRGAVRKAQDLYLKAVELDPGFKEAHLRLAELAVRETRWNDAETSCRLILSLDPLDQKARACLANALLRLERVEEAVLELGQLLDDHPPEDPVDRLDSASKLLLAGDVDRAERHLRAITEMDAPAAVRALAMLRIGLVQLGRGQPELAAETIRAALTIDPDLPEGNEALAAALQVVNSAQHSG